jgi:hypothetical protein
MVQKCEIMSKYFNVFTIANNNKIDSTRIQVYDDFLFLLMS